MLECWWENGTVGQKKKRQREKEGAREGGWEIKGEKREIL